ncbi:pentapeptide repeat-containing protein [Microcoleus sp. FACHB-672]|uniref:pentapeptide repeat-containing protein n=1 Tax=Microcoleus sp. FACHB-672 TaxID=2692825 RepID=UPI0016887D9E|nr:pentapeptide repeat-containing protein [Microcoleus sp. FACHB-672]MBD2042668.1 pentapeptide repeat-containing protein [Microcoleus sp. FACHB-672]
MSHETGVSITKPVGVLKKSIKVNFRDIFKALGKAGVDASFGKWDSLAGDGIEVLAALGLSAGVGEIAWLLVYRSLLQAMQNLVEEKTELESERFNVKALHQQVNAALENSSLTINKKFFDQPEKDSLLNAVQPPFVEWLQSSGLSEAEAQALSYRLPIYFAMALHNEWGNRPKDYAALKEKLDTPFIQANERAQGRLRYSTWLQKQVEEPMFLEAFSLKQVYVPLRAYYSRKCEGHKGDELEARIRGSREEDKIVVDLANELEDWLTKPKKDDAIRLISGDPGSGKSSFAKFFAAKQAEKGTIPVLFIPLHHFEPSDDLVDAVGRFVKADGFLPHNPLDSETGESRLLIIFDGLDELAMQGRVAEKTAQDFVREVQRKVERFNMREPRLQVLISGRQLVVQANSTDFRKEGQIFHVLPYFISENDRKGYVDREELLKQDQRQLWWQYYGKASGLGYEGLPPELDKGNLTEITAQPLLNYLVALSLKRGKLGFSEETNLNVIYDDLLKAIYERGWEGHQHAATQGIEEKDFVRILEEVALAAWHGDGRITTVRAIETHCDNSGLKNLLQRFQEGFKEDSKASVTRLLTAFYFRQSGYKEGEKTFEFTHKSFGEYLTAKRIVREVRLIHKKLQDRKRDPDDGWDERDALHRWALLCGSSRMDEYLFNFVLDEMRLQNLPDADEWQETFCHLIGFMLRHGMPMERLNPRPEFQEENQQARNAEEALLAVLNSCARITEKISRIEGLSLISFGSLISRIQQQRFGPKNSLIFDCLSFLDLSNYLFDMRDFYRANLQKSAFIGSNLHYAMLFGANLYESNLTRTQLPWANLENANLERANLSEANLEGANLSDASLKEANLSDANLERANLSDASLEGANLSDANLEGANLTEANLEGANLSKANLEGANLSDANLEGANLSDANLEGANLEGANLEGANLEGANLEGANLEGANLREANIEGTDLKGLI